MEISNFEAYLILGSCLIIIGFSYKWYKSIVYKAWTHEAALRLAAVGIKPQIALASVKRFYSEEHSLPKPEEGATLTLDMMIASKELKSHHFVTGMLPKHITDYYEKMKFSEEIDRFETTA